VRWLALLFAASGCYRSAKPGGPIECENRTPLGIALATVGAAAAAGGIYVIATPESCDPNTNSDCAMVQNTNTFKTVFIGVPLLVLGATGVIAGTSAIVNTADCNEHRRRQQELIEKQREGVQPDGLQPNPGVP